MFWQATQQTYTKLFTMKLFYHFLIFVFVSLMLVACAKIFTSDSEIKSFNNQPSEVKQEHNDQPGSAAPVDVKKGTFTITDFNYKNLLKTKGGQIINVIITVFFTLKMYKWPLTV